MSTYFRIRQTLVAKKKPLVLLYEVKNINSNSKKIVKKQEEIFGRMNINY